MEVQESRDALLGDISVLDLADEKGLYCTKLLADLGADVIKVERPGGDPTRFIGPFYHDEPHPEQSLYFFNMNTSKRSITLALDNADGRRLFKRLVKRADVVVETFPPGYLDGLGLGYLALKEVNPGLILVSITGFGQAGPYRDFKAPDLVGVATGGLMYFAGFPEDPPYRPYGFQGYNAASLHAAAGILIALYNRDLTGEGQWVDVSVQQCVATLLETTFQGYDVRKDIRKRSGLLRHLPGLSPFKQIAYGLYECKDGYVRWIVGLPFGAGFEALIEWMNDEGMAGDLMDEKWQEVWRKGMDIMTMSLLMADPPAFMKRMEEMRHIDDVFSDWVKTHTKDELYEQAQQRRLICVPVSSLEDLLKNPHLIARGYFVDVEHPELGQALKYPGAPVRLSETPWQITRRAPLIGEHNLDVYEGELGLSREEIATLKQEGAI